MYVANSLNIVVYEVIKQKRVSIAELLRYAFISDLSIQQTVLFLSIIIKPSFFQPKCMPLHIHKSKLYIRFKHNWKLRHNRYAITI
jgi:hypothetical protein